MTNDDKDLKPICSCGHPQSYPIPHRHDWTDREEAIIKHYEFLLRKTTPQQPSEPLKALDIDRIGSKIRARVGEVLCLTLTEQNKVATANDNHTKRIKTD